MMAKHPITIDDLFKIKLASDPQISPDGQLVAVVLTTPDLACDKYRSQIWLVPTDGSTPARQFTFGESRDRSPRWAPDGKSIAFVSDRDKEKKDQLYLISIAGGEARRLTENALKPSAPIWSPDGTKIAYTSKVIAPETKKANNLRDGSDVKSYTRLNYKSNDEGLWDYSWRQVFCLTLPQGDAPSAKIQLTRGMYNHTSPTWSPDSRTIVFSANRSANADAQNNVSDLWAIAAKGGVPKRLTHSKGPAAAPSFSPDGKQIAFVGHANEFKNVTEASVYVMPARGGNAVKITGKFDRTYGSSLAGDLRTPDHGAPPPAWSKDGRTIYFLATDGGTCNLFSVPAKGGVVKQVTHGDHQIIDFSFARKPQRFVFNIGDALIPNDLYVAGANGTLKRIMRINAEALADMQLSKPERFIVNNEEGSVEAWLMKPIGWKSGRKYPAILEIHGGPHSAYGATFFHEFQVLCAIGYAVLYSNPRGSAGYGQEFSKCTQKDWGGRDYRDVIAVMDHALKKYPWIDGKRCGVAGGSYGGYMTSWIITHTNRFKAAVSMRALNNWYSFHGTSDIGHFFASDWYVGGEPWNNGAEYLRHSPIAHVGNCKTPTLVLHSEKDFRCPIEQGEQFYIALKKLGVPTEFVRFPDETHELSRSGKPKHRQERMERIVAWFKRYVK
jgi:dipeptidyl aminopeptidase/acylaminoacyl peptidase